MLIETRLCILLTALLPGMVTASAQTAPTIDRSTSRSIYLDVVIQDKSGHAVDGLQQQDFTLLENRATRPITSFKALNAEQEKVEVILLLDAVNANFQTVAYAKDETLKFLRTNDGHLAHPTAIALLTDKGTQILQNFTTDGNALGQSLDSQEIGLRQITRSSGFYGAQERLQICLTALRQMTESAAALPGRKIVIFISPGWPLLSGIRIDLDAKQQQQIFGDVVVFSTQLRQANVTLYSVNPFGPSESEQQANYYLEFVKGISKPSQTDIGDLGLQVLAIQSGGLAFQTNSDIAGLLKKCLADAESWYRISFDAAVAEHPNEYHHIEVRLDKPGLTVRTRDGYYAQP